MLAFVQARTTSTRLPNKIYMDVGGAPIIYRVISRAKEASYIDDVVVLSPDILPDLPEGTREFVLSEYDENDVLTRFVKCLKLNPCDFVVRLTADCPFLDPSLINFIVGVAVNFNADYCSNVLDPSFPDGVDVEVIKASALIALDHAAKDPRHREHVTLLIREDAGYRERLNTVSIVNDTDLSKIKMSVDTEEDLKQARAMAA